MPYFDKQEIIHNVRITAVAARYSYIKQQGNQWITICPWHEDTRPSLTINDVGTKCYCHVCGGGGNVIDYYMSQAGVPEFKDACQQLGEDNLLNASSKPLVIKDKPIKAAKWQAIKPPKDAVPKFKHYEMGEPVGQWCYRDASGDPLFWEMRYMKADEDDVLRKEPRPITWGRYSVNMAYRWSAAAWQAPRPIYGLDQIAIKKPDSKIFVFEGPRKAELASSLLYNPAVAWGFGAKAWRHSDWSIMKGRHIILFPDNDDPGITAMQNLAQHLLSIGAAIVEIVNIPAGKPNKWDICDEADLTTEQLKELITNRRKVEMDAAAQPHKKNGKAGKFTFDASKLMNDDGVIGVIIPDEEGNLTGEPPLESYNDGYVPPESEPITDPEYQGSPDPDTQEQPEPEGSTERPREEYTHSSDDPMPEPEDIINIKALGQPFNPDWLPLGLGEFAQIQAKIIGSDAGAVAMSILAVCAGAIDDRIKIFPNKHGQWSESARLWVALVGPASVSKSPPITVATQYYNDMDTRQIEKNAPLEKTQRKLVKKYGQKHDEWADGDMTSPAPVPPPKVELNRYVFSNATVEGFRSLLSRNGIERGMLLLVDELAGWFGSFGQYKGGGGADRAEWISTYQGGPMKIERANEGTIVVPNWSASVLGGIQNEKIAEIANKTAEDGLLQRMWFVFLNDGLVSQIPTMDEAHSLRKLQEQYHDLLENLVLLKHNGHGVHMTEEAREVTQALTHKIDEYCKLKIYGPKSISALKKLSGSMHRLCLVLHCLEAYALKQHPASFPVTSKTARQACAIVHQYIMPSIKTFYNSVMGERGYQSDMERVARWLLEHEFTEINVSLLWNNCRGMRQEVGYRREILASLSDCGWLIAKTDKRDNVTGIPKHFKVNPRIYRKFASETIEFRKEMEARKALMKVEGLRNL